MEEIYEAAAALARDDGVAANVGMPSYRRKIVMVEKGGERSTLKINHNRRDGGSGSRMAAAGDAADINK